MSQITARETAFNPRGRIAWSVPSERRDRARDGRVAGPASARCCARYANASCQMRNDTATETIAPIKSEPGGTGRRPKRLPMSRRLRAMTDRACGRMDRRPHGRIERHEASRRRALARVRAAARSGNRGRCSGGCDSGTEHSGRRHAPRPRTSETGRFGTPRPRGTIVLTNAKDEPAASVFYVAYTAEGLGSKAQRAP